MRRFRQRLGTVLAVLGVVVTAYAALTVLWRDPLTSLYNAWQQHQLETALAESFTAYEAPAPPISALETAPGEPAPQEPDALTPQEPDALRTAGGPRARRRPRRRGARPYAPQPSRRSQGSTAAARWAAS